MKLEEQIAILMAAKEGKKIRRTPISKGYAAYIVDAKSHSFDFSSGSYEIVPEPMEIWVNVYDTGWLHAFGSPVFAECYKVDGHAVRTVKFREVLDDV